MSLLLVMGILMHTVKTDILEMPMHGHHRVLYWLEISCLWSSWCGPASTWCVSSTDITGQPSMSTAPAFLSDILWKQSHPQHPSACELLCVLLLLKQVCNPLWYFYTWENSKIGGYYWNSVIMLPNHLSFFSEEE
jgi:hypothetical protein